MSEEQFSVFMDQLNAGRNDADHYDPENMTSPEEWEIDNKTMDAFVIAYNAFEDLFDSLHL